MVSFDFLFWFFLVGLIIALLQDLKRREIDNWLNLFLLIGGSSYFVFVATFENNLSILFVLGFVIVAMFILMNLFYYSRVFAGGDAKLLFAMAPLFVGATYVSSLFNLGVFVLFLMLAGSLYGLSYSLVLFGKNLEEVLKLFRKEYVRLQVKYYLFSGIILLLLGFFNAYFFIFAGLVISFPLVFVFAKSLENVCMVKFVSGKDLQEGDWLVDDIVLGKKTIEANHDGLSKKDIVLLKHKKMIKIKEGLPFAPAFLLGFLGYYFLQDWLLGALFGI